MVISEYYSCTLFNAVSVFTHSMLVAHCNFMFHTLQCCISVHTSHASCTVQLHVKEVEGVGTSSEESTKTANMVAATILAWVWTLAWICNHSKVKSLLALWVSCYCCGLGRWLRRCLLLQTCCSAGFWWRESTQGLEGRAARCRISPCTHDVSYSHQARWHLTTCTAQVALLFNIGNTINKHDQQLT